MLTTRRNRAAGRTALLCLVLVGAAALTACGDDSDETSVGSSPATGPAPGLANSAPSLEGTSWQLSADGLIGVALGQVTVSAQFVGGTISGSSGCNNYTAPYVLNGTSLTIGPQVAATSMACPPPQMAVETAYLARVPQVASYEIVGSTLTLKGADGTPLLTYGAATAAPIAGAWVVTSYYAVTAVTSVVGDVRLTADFGPQTLNGDTGCNTFNGPYAVNGNMITIGPLASTRAACLDEDLQKQESAYLAALQLATTWTLTGTRLDLLRSNGAIAVTLARA